MITYTIPGAISPYRPATGTFDASDGDQGATPASVFAWDVVARGWEMSMAKATVSVSLPSTITFAQCATEGDAAGSACTVTGAGSTTVTLSTADMPPRSGLYLRASLDTPPPGQVHVPWPVALDPLLGTSVVPVLVLIVIAVLVAAIARVLGRSTLEDQPGFPIMYAPPDGLGPVQTVYLVRESVPSEALVATMLHLAERQVVTLTPTGPKTWQITGTGTPEQWSHIDPVSRSVADALGVSTAGAVFLADGSVPAGEVLLAAKRGISGTTTAWARGAGLTSSAAGERLVQLAVVLSALLALACAAWVSPSLVALPFMLFGLVGVYYVARPGVGTRRTAAGRQAWSQSGGFERTGSSSRVR